MKKEKNGETRKVRRTVSASFITGAIALVFLIVGFQTALFVSKVRQKRLSARELVAMEADSAFVAPAEGGTYGGGYSSGDRTYSGGYNKGGNNNGGGSNRGGSYNGGGSYNSGRTGGGKTGGSGYNGTANRNGNNGTADRTGNGTASRTGNHDPKPKRTVENFRFDPNTATVEELQRLGFSEKQAQSIENYRLKGGKFRRKTDFAKSFVVSDSVYRRLEPYIDIPLLDLNVADSAAFTTLPGIGGYFAAKMVEFRTQLGGYSYKEQLMDIYRFDSEKYDGLEDLICINPSNTKPYPLWTLPEDSLALHPYIGIYAAHGIVVFRDHNPVDEWTVENLDKAGILREGMGEKLARCRIEPSRPSE